MEDRSGLFNEIQGFSQRKLKKVETKVVTGTGDNLVEKRGAKGLQTVQSSSLKSSSLNSGQAKKKLDLQVGLVIPGLLIASEDVAQHKSTLEEYAVTHILNLASNEIANSFEDDYNYNNISLVDENNSDMNLITVLDECFEFIDEGRHRGNCLVHCNSLIPGLSRSTAVCIAYLIGKERKTFDEAFNEVKEARAFVRPSLNFTQQLKEYEKSIHGKKLEIEKEDAFTAKKRQEIEAEKEMLKSKVSIKDKLKAFSADQDKQRQQQQQQSEQQQHINSVNRLSRESWQNSTGQVNEEKNGENSEKPVPRKLTSLLSMFQNYSKDSTESSSNDINKNSFNTINSSTNKNNNNDVINKQNSLAPTKKWKPVEIKSLQRTKGPEIKREPLYESVRKSKSKQLRALNSNRNEQIKKTKSKTIIKNESKEEEKEENKKKCENVINDINNNKNENVENVAPWRIKKDNANFSNSQTTSCLPKQTLPAAAPTPPPPPTLAQATPTSKPLTFSSTSQQQKQQQQQQQQINQATKNSSNKQVASCSIDEKEIQPNRMVFGRIKPPPMKIIGREVSIENRKPALTASNQIDQDVNKTNFSITTSPPPPPQQEITIISSRRVEEPIVTKLSQPNQQQMQNSKTPLPASSLKLGQFVKTQSIADDSDEESSEEEEEEEEEEEDEDDEEEESEGQEMQANKSLTRSSTLEILKLIKSKTSVLDETNVGLLGTVDEDDEIDTLLAGLENEGIENIDWAELGIELNEVKDIVEKNKEISEDETEEEYDEEEEEEEEGED